MKLVTYRAGTELRPGFIHGDSIVDIGRALRALDASGGVFPSASEAAHRYGSSVLLLIEQGSIERVREVEAEATAGRLPAQVDAQSTCLPIETAVLVAPIPQPPSMRDGYAFRQHVETARRNRGLDMIPEFDQFPVFYFTNHLSVTGPGDVFVEELHTDRLDYELEAAVVLGSGGRTLSVRQADEAIFGLTIMNDWSARALQMEEMKLSLGPAKGKDFATSLGPYLVTKDELAPYTRTTNRGSVFDLGMRAFVNGVHLSTGNLGDMTWTFAEIIARVSYGVSLRAGEVIGSGTCGTGCLLELNGSKITNNLWLQPGDEVVLEVDHLGKLENRIVKR
jgi:fumarylacetoacetate (FAA) hydrolase